MVSTELPPGATGFVENVARVGGRVGCRRGAPRVGDERHGSVLRARDVHVSLDVVGIVTRVVPGDVDRAGPIVALELGQELIDGDARRIVVDATRWRPRD